MSSIRKKRAAALGALARIQRIHKDNIRASLDDPTPSPSDSDDDFEASLSTARGKHATSSANLMRANLAKLIKKEEDMGSDVEAVLDDAGFAGCEMQTRPVTKRARAGNFVECAGCHQMKVYEARNMCVQCYAKWRMTQNTNLRKCTGCHETKPHRARGYCQKCYYKFIATPKQKAKKKQQSQFNSEAVPTAPESNATSSSSLPRTAPPTQEHPRIQTDASAPCSSFLTCSNSALQRPTSSRANLDNHARSVTTFDLQEYDVSPSARVGHPPSMFSLSHSTIAQFDFPNSPIHQQQPQSVNKEHEVHVSSGSGLHDNEESVLLSRQKEDKEETVPPKEAEKESPVVNEEEPTDA